MPSGNYSFFFFFKLQISKHEEISPGSDVFIKLGLLAQLQIWHEGTLSYFINYRHQ